MPNSLFFILQHVSAFRRPIFIAGMTTCDPFHSETHEGCWEVILAKVSVGEHSHYTFETHLEHILRVKKHPASRVSADLGSVLSTTESVWSI